MCEFNQSINQKTVAARTYALLQERTWASQAYNQPRNWVTELVTEVEQSYGACYMGMSFACPDTSSNTHKPAATSHREADCK